MIAAIQYFNAAVTALFDALLWPFRSLAPLWPMLFISLVSGVVMLWIFGRVSNQAAIAAIKDRIKGNLIAARLFQDDLGVLMRLQGRILIMTLNYMRHSLVPMLIMAAPVMLIMIQLHLRFSAKPLEPGERALVKVKVRDASSLSAGIDLDAPEGVTIETPAVSIASEREIAWRIRADAPGRHALRIRGGGVGEAIGKELFVGSNWSDVSNLRTGASAAEMLLYPGEAPISTRSTIEKIEIIYADPDLAIRFFGWRVNWLVLFFIASIAFGFAFKGVLGVEV